ncbi:phosphate ABC transporter substrate-binding protein PstS family protein [Thermoflavimicrobium daqui]|jgi:phosphate transport system substrate-binding protein|uniref:Phosphate-binding protein n=1 Tax=Thermoflavimicrobium daqui TaxID=2137476 RepID=A0A364K9D6_9BACL|nr:phosphate ABC transporter substrate-binding protein PstS family protein [Thermoflavimicrobium daqui]RAL26832.1 phosphate-binding protein [Thermoflavimicrobium daqui]
MFKKGMLLGGVVALAFTALVGCGSASTKNQSGGENKLSGTLTAVGSSAMQPVVEEASKEFMSKNPGVQVTVQGGGSGQGLTSAMNDTADIGNSDVFAEEKEKIDPQKVVDHKVFVVGMAPVAHPQVGIDNLTQQQLIDIFTGKVKNWKEVGGKDQKIVLVNRPESSGTRATFAQWALKGNKEFRGQGGLEEESSGTVRKIVAETPGAIGYLAFSYFDKSVIALKLDGVEPKNENVYDNKWKIWAYQHMYTNKNGKNKELEEAFIKFITAPETQQGLVTKLGYIPVTNMKVERDAKGNITKK